MTENTQPPRCTEAEFKAAREAGLPIFTTADERAIHAFAEAIRQDAYAQGYAAAIEFVASGATLSSHSQGGKEGA